MSSWRHELSCQVDFPKSICCHGEKISCPLTSQKLRWDLFFWPLPRGYNFYTEQTLQFNRQASWRLRVRVWVIWYLYFSSTVIMQRKKWCQEELTRPLIRPHVQNDENESHKLESDIRSVNMTTCKFLDVDLARYLISPWRLVSFKMSTWQDTLSHHDDLYFF